MTVTILLIAPPALQGPLAARLGGEGRRVIVAADRTEARLVAEIERPEGAAEASGLAAGGEAALAAALAGCGCAAVRLVEEAGDGAAAGDVPIAAAGAWAGSLRRRPPVDPEDALAVLRERYAAALPGRACELAEKVDAALAGDEEASGAARQVAHRLRGSAGTYGFPAIGEVGAAIEEALVLGGEAGRAALLAARRRLDRWASG